MKRDYTEARRFINEFRYATGCGDRRLPNLPDLSDLRLREEVRMAPEQLIRFRNNYRLLAEFAALVCNTTVDKLCALDLMAYLGMLKSSEDEFEL